MADTGTSHTDGLNRKTVMIFDDNAVMLERLGRFIRRLGFHTELVRVHTDKYPAAAWHQPASIHEIKQLIAEIKPDIILTDFDMHLQQGDVTGQDVLGAAHQILPQTPVILSTGKITGIRGKNDDEIADFKGMGFKHVLGKSDVDGLEQMLRDVGQIPQLGR